MYKRPLTLLLSGALVLGAACSEEMSQIGESREAEESEMRSPFNDEQGSEPAHARAPGDTVGTPPRSTTRSLSSLCTLVHAPNVTSGGIYVVASMENARSDDEGAVTHVTLQLEEPWFAAEELLVVRISGGLLTNGIFAVPRVPLKIAERLGALFTTASDNRGYLSLLEQNVFHQTPDGGLSNGELFTHRVVREDDLGNMVRRIADAMDCSYDEQPDYHDSADRNAGE